MGIPAGRTFADLIQPYIKNEQVWKCPSCPKIGDPNPRVSYHMNGCMNGIAIANLASVSKTAVFRDPGSGTSYDRCFLRPDPVGYQYAATPVANDCNANGAGTVNTERTGVFAQNGPHFDGYTVCFADGHVKWIAREAYLLTPPNAKVVFSPDGLR